MMLFKSISQMRMNDVKNSAHSGYHVCFNRYIGAANGAELHADLGFLIAHHILATVVTALGAYGVINMPCTTVGALSDGRSHSHIVGAALSGTSLRLSSFRMCHFLVVI
jgi:hypothetical protein